MDLKAISFQIEEINGKNYIRFFNDNESISTVALLETPEKQKGSSAAKVLVLGSTVCTTTACANCCGCIPNGNYCTLCNLDSEDCKRTTSGTIDPTDP